MLHPIWATLHPIWAMLHLYSYAALSELSCNLLSYTVPFWAIRCILLNYAVPYWDKLQLSELGCALLSYATSFWTTLHPTELRLTPNEICDSKNIMSLAIAASLILTVELMIHRENPVKILVWQKFAKMYYFSYSSLIQLQVALCTYMLLLRLGLNKVLCIIPSYPPFPIFPSLIPPSLNPPSRFLGKFDY